MTSRIKIHNRMLDLRQNMTEAERILWKALRGKKIEGRKFRRQHQIGKYIVDFYCFQEKLVIELDGMHHFTAEGIKANNLRDDYLKSIGHDVVHFENQLVVTNLSAVIATISKKIKKS